MMTTWECINMYGAIVYDGLFENEALLIASQHGLRAREDEYKAAAIRRYQEMKQAKGELSSDEWYAVEVKRMSERSPA
jgi:hypothetical protein